MAEMCRPDRMVWIDGSEEEKARLEKEAFATGELSVEPEKNAGLVYHRTASNDVARTEHLTYICTTARTTPAPPTTGWRPRTAYRQGRARSSAAP